MLLMPLSLSFSPPPSLKIAFLPLPDPNYSPLAQPSGLHFLLKVVAMTTPGGTKQEVGGLMHKI